MAYYNNSYWKISLKNNIQKIKKQRIDVWAWYKQELKSPRTESYTKVLLDDLGYKEEIDYIREYKIKPRHWRLDFAFPKKKKAIEVQGDYWHRVGDKICIDYEKRLYFEKKGWSVLAVWESEIYTSLEELWTHAKKDWFKPNAWRFIEFPQTTLYQKIENFLRND